MTHKSSTNVTKETFFFFKYDQMIIYQDIKSGLSHNLAVGGI